MKRIRHSNSLRKERGESPMSVSVEENKGPVLHDTSKDGSRSQSFKVEKGIPLKLPSIQSKLPKLRLKKQRSVQVEVQSCSDMISEIGIESIMEDEEVVDISALPNQSNFLRASWYNNAFQKRRNSHRSQAVRDN